MKIFGSLDQKYESCIVENTELEKQSVVSDVEPKSNGYNSVCCSSILWKLVSYTLVLAGSACFVYSMLRNQRDINGKIEANINALGEEIHKNNMNVYARMELFEHKLSQLYTKNREFDERLMFSSANLQGLAGRVDKLETDQKTKVVGEQHLIPAESRQELVNVIREVPKLREKINYHSKKTEKDIKKVKSWVSNLMSTNTNPDAGRDPLPVSLHRSRSPRNERSMKHPPRPNLANFNVDKNAVVPEYEGYELPRLMVSDNDEHIFDASQWTTEDPDE